MENDIIRKQNQEISINMIAAFRQKYSDVKRVSLIQVVLSIWLSIVFGTLALALKSELVTGIIGVPQLDISLYVSFYCVVIALLDLFLFNKLIDSGKELAAKIQERFDTYVFEMPWNKTLAGPKPDAEVINSLKNNFNKVNGNKSEYLTDWYNPKVENVSHHKGVLLCQRMNLYWDKSLRQAVNQRIIIALVCWCTFILIVALSQDLSLRTLLLTVICPLLPILSFSFKLISDNKKSITNLTRLKEVLESAWIDAKDQDISIAKLREVQNEIYQHRKVNRPISDRFYWKLKDEFEGDAQYSIEEMIAELQARNSIA